jgi:aminoglycoside phosphotransferase (APT) family kinase protein
VQTFQPKLGLLRQALGQHVQDCNAELIKTTFAWSLVYRVTLDTNQGHSTRESVILKAINPAGPRTALEADREPHFYRTVYPSLTIRKPEVYYLGIDMVSGWHVIIMQDLSVTHRIPQHPYKWTRAELGSVLLAYAQLHHAPAPAPSSGAWLSPRHEAQLEYDQIPEQAAAVTRTGKWGTVPELSSLITVAREGSEKFKDVSLALLHNDTTPTNAPLPKELESEPATLIDWQDAGIGMPEMDLAYMDLQPFESARGIPRSELLDIYWQHRGRLGGEVPAPEARAARQLHADLVMALWLTRTACRVAIHPYPEGSYQRMHWDSQFGIVYKRLVALSSGV